MEDLLHIDYIAHNAVEDVASLSKLLDHCKCETTLLESHSFSIQSCKLMHDYCVVIYDKLIVGTDIKLF